jgi:glycosyltransferase involved in cell wall biosynthesis
MCRAIQSRDCETLIATTDADGSGRLPVTLNEIVVHEGVPTVFFPRQWSEAFKFSRPLSRWLREHVRGFDVVHIHAVFSHACLSAANACRRSGVPYIVRPLGTLDPWSMRQKPFRKQLMWRLSASRMLRGAAAVHYTTSEEKSLAETSLGINHGFVLPLGIEIEPPPPKDSGVSFRRQHQSLGDAPYIIALSRIHPKKNLESLLEAFLAAVKRKEFKDWRLVIAGDGDADYITSLQRKARQGADSAPVLFTGWLDGVTKTSALREAELLALVSHQENFGLCAAEALACGVPVLVSRQVNLAAEVEKIGAGWVAGAEPAGLLFALEAALANAAERKRRGAAGREYTTRHFSWLCIASELTDLYRDIVTNGARLGGR